MNTTSRGIGRRPVLTLAIAIAIALIIPALASAHARVSPAVSLAGKLQLYSLAVPTEKTGLTTTQDRDDGPERLRDRLVRAAAAGLASGPAADRLGRQRGDHRR